MKELCQVTTLRMDMTQKEDDIIEVFGDKHNEHETPKFDRSTSSDPIYSLNDHHTTRKTCQRCFSHDCIQVDLQFSYR